MSHPSLPCESSSRWAPTAPEPPPRVFACTRRSEGGGSIRLTLAGELDLAERGSFETALGRAQADSGHVVLDLEALTLIDCAALFVVFAAAAHSHREATTLILLSPRGQVRRVLDLVGVPAGTEILEPHDLPIGGSGVAA